MTTSTAAPPTYDDVEVVVPAPGAGPGNWAGAACAVLVDGVFWLTWRVRRPLTDGRGVAVVVARSDDGVRFEPVAEVPREAFGAESFERPVLVPLPEGGWRLYLSCATPDSKHWWVDSLTADTVEGLPTGVRQRGARRATATPAVKDPVVDRRRRRLARCGCAATRSTEPGHEDRMTTRRLTSPDGLDVDRPRRGARRPPGAVGRARRPGHAPCSPRPAHGALRRARRTPTSNWYETTGVARWDGVRLVADRRAADRLAALRRRVPLRHRRAAARRPHPLLRRGGPPRRGARPGHLRALTRT